MAHVIKAKNVSDTAVYRFGDFSSAWASAAILPYGMAGLAIFGAIVSGIWFPVAYLLGKRYEQSRGQDAEAADSSISNLSPAATLTRPTPGL